MPVTSRRRFEVVLKFFTARYDFTNAMPWEFGIGSGSRRHPMQRVTHMSHAVGTASGYVVVLRFTTDPEHCVDPCRRLTKRRLKDQMKRLWINGEPMTKARGQESFCLSATELERTVLPRK